MSGFVAGAKTGLDLLGLFLSVKSILGGGNNVDPALQKIQHQIGQAMLKQMQQEQAVVNPFRQGLAQLLAKRTGQQLPISDISVPNIRPALANVSPTKRTVDPASFLGQKASRNPQAPSVPRTIKPPLPQ